jgi:hypothetical protein
MGNTLATMITMTTYGTWLRGDYRGWVDDGRILPPDPILEEAARTSTMSLQILFLLILAFAVFVVVPIALVLAATHHIRHKASDRPTGRRVPIRGNLRHPRTCVAACCDFDAARRYMIELARSSPAKCR